MAFFFSDFPAGLFEIQPYFVVSYVDKTTVPTCVACKLNRVYITCREKEKNQIKPAISAFYRLLNDQLIYDPFYIVEMELIFLRMIR